ncbi:MAG: metallophosphoesterase [Pseudomonadota bacterium]
MRILHLSDFHLVHHETLSKVEIFRKRIAPLGINFPLSASRAADGERLLQHLKVHEEGKVDAIVFSGDATSLGDDNSMREAGLLLREIASICLKSGDQRHCIAIPGNHDVLECGLRSLLDDLHGKLGPGISLIMRFAAGGKFKEFIDALSELLDSLDATAGNPSSAEQASNFRNFLQLRFREHFDPFSSDSLGDSVMLRTVDGSCINGDEIQLNICPVNTVPTQPLFINMGMATGQHLRNIVANRSLFTMRNANSKTTVNLAVTHQGLMTLSRDAAADSADQFVNLTTVLEHSITSQVNGFILGKALQAAGYDAHLHGHEHHNTTIRFDFDVERFGSIYSVGAGSAFEESGQPLSFLIHELPNPFCMTVTNYQYDNSSSTFSRSSSNIIFDKIKSGNNTMLAKKEITNFFFKDDERNLSPDARVSGEHFTDECDKLLVQSRNGLLVFGVNLANLRNNIRATLRDSTSASKKEAIKRRLTERGLDILVVKPMWTSEAYAVYDNKDIISDISTLRCEWKSFFEEVASYSLTDVNTLIQKCRIRYTPTPIAHAGICEYVPNDEGSIGQPKFSKALIQIIKVVEAFDNEIFLQLDYRVKNGLLRYYAGSAWNLWNKSDEQGELFAIEGRDQVA